MRFAALLWLVLSLYAQSPYEVAPENYQKLFEDENFRVSKATYKAGDKIKFHAHPLAPTVYVYLTDSGPVRFFHAGGAGIRRAPLKAGSIRFAAANTEFHEVENLGDITSEFLRIEILKPIDLPRSHVRSTPEFASLDNGGLRIEKIACAPKQECATPNSPGVLVLLGKKTAELHTRRYANNTDVVDYLIIVSLRHKPISSSTQPN